MVGWDWMVGGISEKVNFRELSHVITEPNRATGLKAIHKPDAVFTTISTVLDFTDGFKKNSQV
jgi:hypothetical protein